MPDDERLKFEGMVNFIWAQSERGEPGSATIECPNSSMARKLRRRLYYLRDQSTGKIKDHADKMAFRLHGRIVAVELLPHWQPKLSIPGEPADDQKSQGDSHSVTRIFPDGTVPEPDSGTTRDDEG